MAFLAGSNKSLLIILLVCVCAIVQTRAETKVCYSKGSPCFMKKIQCPTQCPYSSPSDPKVTKVCVVNCNSPICKAECKNRKANCNSPGSACHDPRFIGGDGIVFYFHGKKNEHFTLVSDPNLQINARFIGLRPEGRSRDYTWIQALGLLFDSTSFTLEATPSPTWNPQLDHLKFTYNDEDLLLPSSDFATWESKDGNIRVERTSSRNSVMITIPEVAEISVNVVPVTKEDDRVHNYKIPSDDCFAHLEVQFRFFGLSEKVEGVLGRTYQADFVNPAKAGVAMAIVGGEEKYATRSLVSAECLACVFKGSDEGEESVMEYSKMDCSGGAFSGNGIVCRK